jgi:trehalose-6-phosphatase
MVAKELYS